MRLPSVTSTTTSKQQASVLWRSKEQKRQSFPVVFKKNVDDAPFTQFVTGQFLFAANIGDGTVGRATKRRAGWPGSRGSIPGRKRFSSPS
jgi:hypothetical protein